MWQTIALYGAGAAVVFGIVYAAMRMMRRDAGKGAKERERRMSLEQVVEEDRKWHRRAGLPLPMSRAEHLARLRRLHDRAKKRGGS